MARLPAAVVSLHLETAVWCLHSFACTGSQVHIELVVAGEMVAAVDAEAALPLDLHLLEVVPPQLLAQPSPSPPASLQIPIMTQVQLQSVPVSLVSRSAQSHYGLDRTATTCS